MTAKQHHVRYHCHGFCHCCGLSPDLTSVKLAALRQVVDIPVVRPSYTEHRIYRASGSCSHQTTAAFPAGIDAPISYGNKTTVLIAYLHTHQYMTLARISEFFGSVYAKGISEGIVCGILDRFAVEALPAFELIRKSVSTAKVVGPDETGMRENSKLKRFCAWQSKICYLHHRFT